MTTKPYPALCRDCKHSEPESNSSWGLRCLNPVVNGADHYALASSESGRGTTCLGERERKSFFAKCGLRGKLWEPKA